ncbi:MAG: NAD(P)/FAD-dependent oxidoreductase [Erysipelotrichaceae bacterium]|jgi:uncharacterized FAD-dependent dehydrogenase
MLRIDNVKIFEDISNEEVIKKALKKAKIKTDDFISGKIIRKSIDARDKNNVHYNYIVDVQVRNEDNYSRLKKVVENTFRVEKKRNSKYQPVIIGSGPAGLFCALTLIEYGYKPIIIEQGDCIENRIKAVDNYRLNGVLNTRCNVQFGEGGAGTFSDGKLNTGINSPLIQKVLDTFHHFGAPEEITYLNRPHIGTDNLVSVLKNIRNHIENNGGIYYFNTRFTSFEKKNDLIRVNCENKTFITDTLVLAIGHSARDTFVMLKEKEIEMKKKNFAVGLRIEHKQSMINKAQYGDKTKLKLPPAEYKLSYNSKSGRSCYTFCMCPGGEVIASTSEDGSIVTNGMSYYKRDKENANAALLVNVTPDDFKDDDVLAGMHFQKELEQAAYSLAGSNNNAPVQRVEDFINNVASKTVGHIIPSYKPGYTLTDLNKILPEYVSKTIKEALSYFDKKIKGFNNPDAILTGVETRSSSPVTIVRNENMQASVPKIYPCGEGAGYAGGITSSAVDGIRVAFKIIETE